MNKEIMIGDSLVPLSINALTPILYKNVFKHDMIVTLETMRKGKDSITEFFPQLAFIANKQALGIKTGLTYDEFLDWVEQFDALAFAIAAPEIMAMINANRKTTSTPKN